MKYLKFYEYISVTDIKKYIIINLNDELMVVRNSNNRFRKFQSIKNGEIIKILRGNVDLSPEELKKRIIFQSDSLVDITEKLKLLLSRIYI